MAAATTAFMAEQVLTADVQLFEYSKAANPIESGATPRIPLREFGPELYADGSSREVRLDLSAELGVTYPATGPGVLARFVRVQRGESLRTVANGSSEVFYVIRGQGQSEIAGEIIAWEAGDFVALPGGPAEHFAEQDAAFYTVDDSPLFRYLGAKQERARFRPTVYRRAAVLAELEAARQDPDAGTRSRVSVLLGNRRFSQTMTVTHTLWTMFGVVAPGTRQLPHRHQSVALDFIAEAQPGTYTLLGPELNGDGTIKEPIRVEWVAGGAFVTPPGWWHEHVNASGAEAYVMPVQDAGLHAYLRTLDIQFYVEN